MKNLRAKVWLTTATKRPDKVIDPTPYQRSQQAKPQLVTDGHGSDNPVIDVETTASGTQHEAREPEAAADNLEARGREFQAAAIAARAV